MTVEKQVHLSRGAIRSLKHLARCWGYRPTLLGVASYLHAKLLEQRKELAHADRRPVDSPHRRRVTD